MKYFTDRCNFAKKELDTIKARLDAKTEEKRATMREDLMDGYEDEMDGGMEGGRGSP